MKVAICQIDCRVGESVPNTARLVRAVAEAARSEARLVVFPELCDTGYSMPAVLDCATSWDTGSCLALQESARTNEIAIIAGLAEAAGKSRYDSQAVIDAQGVLRATYRKIHLFRAGAVNEGAAFVAGQNLVVEKIGPFSAGMLICYDLRFPEQSRALVDAGTDLLVISAAWPEVRREHWVALLRARAIENQCFVIAANRCGTDAGLGFAGASLVVDPSGTVLAQGSDHEEQTLLVDLDPTVVVSTRSRFPVLSHRRHDLF